MSEQPRNDMEHDARLAALYRMAVPDEPPPMLDDAIRAAAHREVAAKPRLAGAPFSRSWRLPLSIAAVLVVSVSLVTLMREEAPEIMQPSGIDLSRQPTADSRSTASASAVGEQTSAIPKTLMPGEKKSSGLGLKPSSSSSGLGIRREADAVSSIAQLRKEPAVTNRLQVPAAPAGPGKQLAPEAFPGANAVRDNRVAASVEQPRQATKEEARRDIAISESPRPAAAGALSDAKAQVKSEADSAVREPERARAPAVSAPPVAKPAPAPAAKPQSLQSASQLAGAVQAYAELPPEKWLERIEELRKQGRPEEAKSSLTEFRKRYPDYPLPASLKDGVR